jgi:hypothetical protein
MCGGKMKKRVALVFAATLLLAMAGAAQQRKQEQPSGSPGASKKLTSISGRVGAGGKSFAVDGESTAWTVSNPEILLDTVGAHVRIRARVDRRKHELRVAAVRIAPPPHARLDDSAFRR